MMIPFEWAETVAAVVDAGSLDAAARRLRITPSAVSQRIKALENRLGRVVLLRTKPAQATPAGQAVVRLARQLTLLQHDTLAEFDGDDGRRTSVALAVNADSLSTWFLQPLAELSRRHPVVFDLHRDDQDFTAGLLESGTVMGAVTSRAAPVAGCRVNALGAMRYQAVASVEFARTWFPNGADVAALVRAPVIEFDRKDNLQSVWLRGWGIDPELPPRNYVPSSSDFATATILGLGWALLPSFQAEPGVRAGTLVQLGGDPIDVPLHWQQWNLSSPRLDAIADAIITEGRRVLRPL